MGIRRCESRKRKENYSEPTGCRVYKSKKNCVDAIYPILDWSDDDVREFIIENNVKCHPLYYDERGAFHVERRLGCMCCPLAYYKKRIAEFDKYPKMVGVYIKALQKYFDTHPNTKNCVQHGGDVYAAFVHDVFFPGSREWEKVYNGLFDRPDFRKFVENRFVYER